MPVILGDMSAHACPRKGPDTNIFMFDTIQLNIVIYYALKLME